jgi:hypothetical protein
MLHCFFPCSIRLADPPTAWPCSPFALAPPAVLDDRMLQETVGFGAEGAEGDRSPKCSNDKPENKDNERIRFRARGADSCQTEFCFRTFDTLE